MSKQKYYLIDLERTNDSGIYYFWKPFRRGYTILVSEAGLYDENESKSIVDSDINKTTVRIPEGSDPREVMRQIPVS